MIEEVSAIVTRWAEQEPPHEDYAPHQGGSIHQRSRLREMAELALQNYDGDILEIGCHIGLTTSIFAELAKKYDRRVVVIDPWNGLQEGDESVYQEFKRATKQYEDIIDVNRMLSQSPEAKTVISSGKFAFCWIDGLHTPFACMTDIRSCNGQIGIQAVDDLSWSSEGALKECFYQLANQYGYEHVYDERCREGYYICKGK
tara:strand:- start:4576 stop:5178 length:603 start_codon:yes stop_codon:yes gene_type:complete